MIPLASYRPKKLDELNSFYDKTLSSQNVIEATASSISKEAFKNEPVVTPKSIDDFFAEHTDSSHGSCADLSADISSFIANFGKPATAEDEISIRRKPVVPIKIRNAPTPPKPVNPSPQPETVPEEVKEASPAQTPVEVTQQAIRTPAPQESKPQKVEFVITAEKNELFEEYMRIMSDEDDDANYSKSKSRKKKKAKKSAEAKAEEKTQAKTEAPTPVVISDEHSEAADILSAVEASDDNDDTDGFFSFANEPEKEAPVAATPEIISDQPQENSFLDLSFDEEEDYDYDEDTRRKNPVLQLILFLVLFITLLSAFTVTFIKTSLKVNTGELFNDKYYLYTANYTDEVADIHSGDLILIEDTPVQDGEVLAYESHDNITYAVQVSSVEPQRTTCKNSTGDKITVMNTSIKGKVAKYYPSLGKLISVITENFMTIIVLLLVFAVFIIIILLSAFRHTPKKEKQSSDSKKSAKDNFSFDEQEDMDEATDEDFSLT